MTTPTGTHEMTAPTETARNHLMVQEDDRVIPEESTFDLAGAATSGEIAEDHQMVPEDDRKMPQGFSLYPAGVITTGDSQSPDPDAPEHPAAADADIPTAEPGVVDASDNGSPSAVSAPDAELGPTRAAPVAGDGTSPNARWHEILAMFVDDPRSSIELAASLVDDSAEALMTSVKERQYALLSAWQGDDAGTEEMRIALQQYRTFWNRIEDLSREA
jgi:hypothetical protein